MNEILALGEGFACGCIGLGFLFVIIGLAGKKGKK